MKMLVIVMAAIGLGAGAAKAQESVALAVEGWSTQDRDGTIYFRCEDPRCAPGSRVSYRRQTHRPDLPMSVFEQHHRRLVANARDANDGRVVSASVRDFQEKSVGGAKLYSVKREITWKDGHTTTHIDALLIGPASSYTVLSEAADAPRAMANFNGFLPRLVDIAMLVQPPAQ